MRKVILAALAISSIACSGAVTAQTKFYSRVKLSGAAVAAPVAAAHCGSLVKGSWFVQYESDSGMSATTLAQAQLACNGLAASGAGTCGWTGDTFYGSQVYHVYWTTYVGIRPYNDVNDPSSHFVYAVTCPLG